MQRFKRFVAMFLVLSMVLSLTTVPRTARAAAELDNLDYVPVSKDYLHSENEDAAEPAVPPEGNSIDGNFQFPEQTFAQVSGSINLLANGNFANADFNLGPTYDPYRVSLWYVDGWYPEWGGYVVPNSGLGGNNTSANAANVFGHNGVVSSVITISEPGTYRLSAWGRSSSSSPGWLLLTNRLGSGRNEAYRHWFWENNEPIYWADLAAVDGFAVTPSIVQFNGENDWVYKYTEFYLSARTLQLFENQFRVAMHSWGGDVNITGITLTKVEDNGGQTVDRTALGAAITAAQGRTQTNYTPASWGVLASALYNAITVYGNNTASQTDVTNAANTLQDAINNLEPENNYGQHPNALTGTPFGNRPNPHYAFDGDADTYFVSQRIYPQPPQYSGYDTAYYWGYVGLDFGAGNYYRITNVRVFPRYVTGQPWIADRASGNIFGSADGTTWVHLGRIDGSSDIAWREWLGEPAQVANRDGLFRYVRIVGLRWWDSTFAEIEIFGYTPQPCVDCNEYPCECPEPPTPCPDCGAYPCLCTSVTDLPPGTFGAEIFREDFENGLGAFTFGAAWATQPSLQNDSTQGNFIRFYANDGSAAAHVHGYTPRVNELYVLSITFRTNTQNANRSVGVGSHNTNYMHFYTYANAPSTWNAIQVPISADWVTAYMVFQGRDLGGGPLTVLLDRFYRYIGHGIWDISLITIHEFNFTAADKTALAAAITAAEAIADQELYTPATWVPFQTALGNARAVYNNPLAEQSAVTAATTSLQNAYTALALRTVDAFRAMLDNLITQAQALNQGDFTATTWAALITAIGNAQAVYGNTGADIAAIRAQLTALQAAIDGLGQQQQALLLRNGNFSSGWAYWNGPTWMPIVPNTGQNSLNTSDNMVVVGAGWNRFTSDIITINEPGWYRLSAWGMAPGGGDLQQLFLTYQHHSGASEHDRDFRWNYYWRYGYLGRTDGTRVTSSVVNFSGVENWTQLSTAFELTPELLTAYNYSFRVAFRTEGNTAPLTITGIVLERVCDDCRMEPCICNEVICKDALELAIAAAEVFTVEMLYTPATWATLQTALNTARTVFANQFVSQGTIDTTTNALLGATTALTERTISELQDILYALITNALSHNQTDYRPGTWTPFANALDTAQDVNTNSATTAMAIVNAYNALTQAIAELVALPPVLSPGNNLFDDGFSRHTAPSVTGWINYWRVDGGIRTHTHSDIDAYHYIQLSTDHAVMRKPVELQGNVTYRMSAWVRGGGGNISGAFLTPTLGSPNPPGSTHANICHDTWCGCEAFRIARIVSNEVADWEFRTVYFTLDADFSGEVMLRSWPGSPLQISDIRIEVVQVFETYGVTFGVSAGNGTLTAAIGLTPIQHGSTARPGTVVTFTANPAIGYTVDRWVVNGVETNDENRTYTATVNADIDVRVFFKPAEGVIVTHSASGGPGTVVARANGRGAINSGTVVASGAGVPQGSSLTFTVTPGTGYEVRHWLINGNVVNFIGNVFLVPYLQGIGTAGALTYTAEAVLQEIDLTGGRFDPTSSRNTTYRGQLGININRDSSFIVSGSGLSSVFSDAMLASMAPYGLIRFMNYTNTNNHFTVSEWSATEATLWGEVIALSNATNVDIWICVPANANDNYIRQLAILMEEHLNPYINVYVEWGNEIWGFANQQAVNRRMALERGMDDRRVLYHVYNVWWYMSDYFHFAQRTAEIAFIFREVFGEDGAPINLNSRVRPILTWQVIPRAFEPMVDWLDGRIPLGGYPDWHTNGTPGQGTRSDPIFRNPHEYIWGVGIAPYFSEPHVTRATDIDLIHRHMLSSIEGWTNTLATIVYNANNVYGFIGGAVTYEGGPHYVTDPDTPGDTNLAIRTAAQNHPLMVDLLNYYIMNIWFEVGGSLYTHYRHLGAASPWGHWGVKDNLTLEQFKFAAKYESHRFISLQERGTRVPRPEVAPPPPFVSPIQNPSFEYTNPQAHWNLGSGWIIDRTTSADGESSLRYDGSYAGPGVWHEVNTSNFALEPHTDYVFSFWHKGEAGFKVIVGGASGEYYAITEQSDVWVEYLVPFYTGVGTTFNLKIGHEWNANPGTNPDPGRVWDGDAWFDFFFIDENRIVNPSFERGMSPWAHGLGWIGSQPFARSTVQPFDGNYSLRVFGELTPDGLNSNDFTLRANADYRFIFYSRGGDNFNAPILITNGAVDLTTTASTDWVRYEQRFSTVGMSVLTGNVRTSLIGYTSPVYADNFMLFTSRVPVPILRHVVSFNLNYPNPPAGPVAQNVVNNGRATLPTPPTRADFDFLGWFDNPEGTGTPWNFALNPVVSTFTLYASWQFDGTGTEPVTHLVTFDLNFTGATDAPLSQRVYNGEYATEPTPPIRVGYTFVEWQLSGVAFDFNTPITGDIVLIAAWVPVALIFTVTFDLGFVGATGAPPPQFITENETATAPTPPNRTGYNFVAWQLNGVAFNFNTPITGNITLTATWNLIPVPHTVTFDLGFAGATDVPPAQLVYVGNTATAPNPPTRSGYTFAGWQLNGVAFNFNTPITGNITLTATWSLIPVPHTVTFDLGFAGATDVPPTQLVDDGNTATAPNPPTRSGYTFAGWQLNGAAFDFNTPITANITITASWTTLATPPSGGVSPPLTVRPRPPANNNNQGNDNNQGNNNQGNDNNQGNNNQGNNNITELPPPPANETIFTTGNTSFIFNGVVHESDVAPFIDSATNRMMVPLRAIAEVLGYEVEWCSETRSALIHLPASTLRLPAGVPLPNDMGMPYIVNGRMFVPLRFIMETLGANVAWDSANRAAIIEW